MTDTLPDTEREYVFDGVVETLELVDTEGEGVEKKLVTVVIEEEGHSVPVPELEKERLDVPDTLTDTEPEYVFEGEALTLPVVDEERHAVTVPEVVGVIEEVVEDEQEPLTLKEVLKVVWVDLDTVEVTESLDIRDMLLKLVDVGTVDKEGVVETDTDGEILFEDWEVRELQPVPVTDDDTH